jgi:hypothetical protein
LQTQNTNTNTNNTTKRKQKHKHKHARHTHRYGGGPSISRFVIEEGEIRELRVEVYLLPLRVCVYDGKKGTIGAARLVYYRCDSGSLLLCCYYLFVYLFVLLTICNSKKDRVKDVIMRESALSHLDANNTRAFTIEVCVLCVCVCVCVTHFSLSQGAGDETGTEVLLDPNITLEDALLSPQQRFILQSRTNTRDDWALLPSARGNGKQHFWTNWFTFRKYV